MNDQERDPESTPIEPNPNTRSGDRYDETTGGEDSSPFEATPSGEQKEAAEEPQNAPLEEE